MPAVPVKTPSLLFCQEGVEIAQPASRDTGVGRRDTEGRDRDSRRLRAKIRRTLSLPRVIEQLGALRPGDAAGAKPMREALVHGTSTPRVQP